MYEGIDRKHLVEEPWTNLEGAIYVYSFCYS